MVYQKLKKVWADKGVLFLDTSSALRDHPELFKKYFATIIPPHDNKIAALNSAVWSGGSFVYVPKGVSIDMPYKLIFALIPQAWVNLSVPLFIADECSHVHY